MEEILASIRQIISEDLASTAAAEDHPHAAEAADDVLVLKDRAPPEPSPFAPPAEPEPPEPKAAEPQLAETDTLEPPAAEPPAADAQPAAPEPVGGRNLAVAPAGELAVVGPDTAAVVAASFERLSFVVENKPPPPPPFPVSAGGATLEDITRDILTPVIRAWLDENLASIVQARVDEEVERITRGRVR